eukprot:2208138-Rhodomonas_salina.1
MSVSNGHGLASLYTRDGTVRWAFAGTLFMRGDSAGRMPHGSHDDDKLAVRSGEHAFTVSYSRSRGLEIEREAHHVEYAPD